MKRVVLVLQTRESQILILNNDAVEGIDFFADIRTCKFRQIGCSGSVGRGRFKAVCLSSAEALLKVARFVASGWHEMYVHQIAPRNVADVKMAFAEGLQRP